jgi:hypothetical protein
MGIIRNKHNNIVVIYEIKSFYVTLAAVKFFPNNIHRANYHFTHSKKLKKNDNTTVLPLSGIVYRKRPFARVAQHLRGQYGHYILTFLMAVARRDA